MEFKKINNNLINEGALEEFSQKFNLNKKVVEILFNRGIDTAEKIDKFLNENINDLKDPFLLINMKETVNRINVAIKNNEKILIFGDYDVDGISATAILYNYLITKTQNVATYLPNRFEDGYGLSCPCLDKVAKIEHPNLIITVDCGISCFKEVEYIKQMGIDVIVTDHHELPEILPKCLIVSTKFDQPFNFKGLCGAGVSFKIVQALCIKNNENYAKFLPIAALATIADIVPLVDENRIIVKEGLKRLNQLPLGVQILLKKNLYKLNNVTSSEIGFKIAPLINSAGRLDDANIALKLFTSSNLKVINNSLTTLIKLNEKRKTLCKIIYDDCVKMLENENKNNKTIVLYNENWEIGLLGIVSSRISEDYNKLTILFGKNNGELKGSSRTPNDINIFEMFSSLGGFLTNFGGHAKAGGLSLKEENFKSFKKAVEEYVANNFAEKEPIKYYDLELTENEITADFVKDLAILEPFGYENTNPIFKVKFTTLKISHMKALQDNLIISPKDNLELISFNDAKNFENYSNFINKEMLVELSLNNFNNQITVKGIVKEVIFKDPKPLLQTKLDANLLEQLNYNNSEGIIKKYTSLKQLLNLNSNKTLYISYNLNNPVLNELKNIYITTFNISKPDIQNTLLFGIKSIENFSKFNKIVFLDNVININFANFISKFTKTEVYVPLNNEDIKFMKTREELLDVYYSLIKAINKNISADNIYSYYEFMLTKFNVKYSYKTFYVAILIFKELKLIEQLEQNYKIYFKLNKIKTNLENSTIFKLIN